MGIFDKLFGRKREEQFLFTASPASSYRVVQQPAYALHEEDSYITLTSEVAREGQRRPVAVHVTLPHPANPLRQEHWDLNAGGKAVLRAYRNQDGTLDTVFLERNGERCTNVFERDPALLAAAQDVINAYAAVLDLPHYRKLTADLPLPDVLGTLEGLRLKDAFQTPPSESFPQVFDRKVEYERMRDVGPVDMTIDATVRPADGGSVHARLVRSGYWPNGAEDTFVFFSEPYVLLSQDCTRAGFALITRGKDGKVKSSYDANTTGKILARSDEIRGEYARALDVEAAWNARPAEVRPRGPRLSAWLDVLRQL